MLVLDTSDDRPGFGGFGGFGNIGNKQPSFGGFGGFGGFGRIPGFSQSAGSFGGFPSRLPPSFGFEDSSPSISLDLGDIFGGRPSVQGGRVPEILTSLFDVLGDSLGVEVEQQGGQGEGQGEVAEDGQYDHHNTTYDEKVRLGL